MWIRCHVCMYVDTLSYVCVCGYIAICVCMCVYVVTNSIISGIIHMYVDTRTCVYMWTHCHMCMYEDTTPHAAQERRNRTPNTTKFSFCGLLVLLQYHTSGNRDFTCITGTTDQLVYPITLQIGSKQYSTKSWYFLVVPTHCLIFWSGVEFESRYLYRRQIPRDFTTHLADFIRKECDERILVWCVLVDTLQNVYVCVHIAICVCMRTHAAFLVESVICSDTHMNVPFVCGHTHTYCTYF